MVHGMDSVPVEREQENAVTGASAWLGDLDNRRPHWPDVRDTASRVAPWLGGHWESELIGVWFAFDLRLVWLVCVARPGAPLHASQPILAG
jgi:hypothetical protein